jgi:hypothetical protein
MLVSLLNVTPGRRGEYIHVIVILPRQLETEEADVILREKTVSFGRRDRSIEPHWVVEWWYEPQS